MFWSNFTSILFAWAVDLSTNSQISEESVIVETGSLEPVIEPSVEEETVLEQPVLEQSVPMQEVNGWRPDNGRKPDIEVKKTSEAPIEIGNGVYEIKYNIEVKNTGWTGLYTLTDDINIPYWVTHVVSWLGFVLDDDLTTTPAVNPSFDGDSQDTIILNETILANNKDKFSYKVTYTIDTETSSSDVTCNWEQNDEEIVLVKNMASVVDKKERPRDWSNWATTQFIPGHHEDENDEDDALCIELGIPEMKKTIVVDKIVCEDEEDLPNWWAWVKVDENTASDFLAENEDCHLVPDRNFQYSLTNAPDSWITFAWSVAIPEESINGTVYIHEVLEDWYIPFSNDIKNDKTAELYCETDWANYDNEEWIHPNDDETYNCVAFNYKEPTTVDLVAQKIVCDEESYLPNWGLWANDITATTASDFLATGNNAQHCKLVDWDFQWGTSDITNPWDDLIWEAWAGWNTFSWTTQINTQDIEKIWIREVLQEKYIPFTYGLNWSTNDDNVSAEIYCHNDAINYDNYDSVIFDENIDTYHCLAFNYKPQMLPVADPKCEDWKRYAKVTLNEENGWLNTPEELVWFGNKIVPIGSWFELPSDAETSSHTQWAVLTYKDNKLTVDLLNAPWNVREDFAWTIELYWAKVSWNLTKWRPGFPFYRLEDWTGKTLLDIFEKESNQMINFDFATTTGSDEWSMILSDNTEICKVPFKIVARKIVCEDEADLPNIFWWNVSEIDSDTAQDWVDSHDSCKFVEWWNFQYWFNEVIAPVWSYTWTADSFAWSTFGITDSNGLAETSIINLDNISKIKVREVLQDDYIPFTDKIGSTEPEYTAEIYCGTDIQNYDNEEWLMGDDLWYWKTVYCVAWNAPKGPDPLPKCWNDFSVNNEKDLSIIDLPTGVQTYVNDLEFGSSAAATDPTTWNIYYIENKKNNPRIGYYNITNHTNTSVWNTGTSNLITKLAFNQAGVLYAMTDENELFTININNWVASHIDTLISDKDGWDIVFDDNGDLYIILKGWKLYKYKFSSNEFSFVWYVIYNKNKIQSTWLVFKNWLFYVTDNNQKLYSFSISDIANATLISSTNNINDLASCPVEIQIRTGSVGWYKFNDKDRDWKWDQPCGQIYPSSTTAQLPRCMSHEYAIAWWGITLTSKSDSEVVYTWSTDETWKYLFTDIPVWEYTICEVQQNWWTQTFPANNACHDVIITVEQPMDYNFGNHKNWICDASNWCGNWSSNSVWNGSKLIIPGAVVENIPQISTFQEEEEIVYAWEEETPAIEPESEGWDIDWVYADYLAKTTQLSEMEDGDEKVALQSYLNGSNISLIFKLAISKFIKKLETLPSDKRAEKTLEIFSRLDELSKSFEEGNVLLDILNYFKLKLAISYNNI